MQIFWQAKNGYDGKLYSGGYATAMTFMLKKSWGANSTIESRIVLVDAANVLPDSIEWYVKKTEFEMLFC